KLIPLISHRYLPEEPHEAGNPVFSVYQSDVIYYGTDLIDYFEREFTGRDYRPRLDQLRLNQMKHIRFWSDLVERSGGDPAGSDSRRRPLTRIPSLRLRYARNPTSPRKRGEVE